MQQIMDRVVKVIVDQLDVSAADINIESRFIEDLGADSLDTVELVMAFEEEFDVEIADDVAEQIKTVKDVITLVGEQVAA